MPIPLYGVEAGGGRIITMDDEAVVNDLTNEAGSGGNAYSPYVVSTVFDDGLAGGYGTFRRAAQHVHADGAVQVDMTPFRDEQETGQTITRSLSAGDNFVCTAPFKAPGTTFCFKVTLSSFDAPVELGKADLWIVPRRTVR